MDRFGNRASCRRWFFTNLEAVVWGELVNLLEHLCYAANAVLMAVWCGLLLRRGRSA